MPFQGKRSEQSSDPKWSTGRKGDPSLGHLALALTIEQAEDAYLPLHNSQHTPQVRWLIGHQATVNRHKTLIRGI